jgi:UDP-2,3-diacylglucosamine pyrophosphatase LpxH
MRVALASDLHLEFGDLIMKNDQNADVLLLAGDICVAKELPYTDSKYYDRFHDFFSRCAFQFKDVIYISGNHEHYHGAYDETYNILRTQLAKHTNIHILNNEHITIGDTLFFGGTLWTDFNKEDPKTMGTIRSMMNDFRIITAPGGRKSSWKSVDGNLHYRNEALTPDDVLVEHKDFLDKLNQVILAQRLLNSHNKVVVVGHHAPSKLSTKPQYEKDWEMNGGYSSDLTDFIMDHPEIKLWVHGHTHHTFDYNVGSTRILCNPRGYVGYEVNEGEFKLITVEV